MIKFSRIFFVIYSEEWKMRLFFIGIIILIGCNIGLLQAQNAPILINYQALLKDNSGNPINGQVGVTFRLYDSIVSGNLLWSETQNNLLAQKGIINTNLGSVTPLKSYYFIGNKLFLELEVSGNGILSPRLQFTAVPFAINTLNSYHLLNSSIMNWGNNATFYDTIISANTVNQVLRIELDVRTDNYNFFDISCFCGPSGAEIDQGINRLASSWDGGPSRPYDVSNPQAWWNIPVVESFKNQNIHLYLKIVSSNLPSSNSVRKLYIWGQ